jgi:hypothetical protein
MRWWRELFRRVASRGRWTAGKDPFTTNAQGRDDGELTDRQREDNAWAAAGWVAVWEPTAAARGNREARLWARSGDHGLLRLFAGRVPPKDVGAARFYVKDGKVYRDQGHPDGPSSIPYYIVRTSYVYPAEGYPSGPDDRIRYRVRHFHEQGRGIRVARNVSFGDRDGAIDLPDS